MKNLLLKLLGIQTWKIVLMHYSIVNDDKYAIDAFKNMPVKIILTDRVIDIKVIDTGIIAFRKGGDTHGKRKTISSTKKVRSNGKRQSS